jgi:hypothetical protein
VPDGPGGDCRDTARGSQGPLILSEKTGLPYLPKVFLYAWRQDFAAAGLPPELWNRDMRASALTEGRRHGATTDDLAKMAGHAKPKITAEVYDRDTLEAVRRSQGTRIKGRAAE